VKYLMWATVALVAFSTATGASEPRASVVKIYVERRYPDYQFPWSAGTHYATTGSGVVIAGKRILTNAHVVSDHTFIQVRRYGGSEKTVARVASVSHEADLAILTVDEEDFFDSIPPLPLGDLPEVQQSVVVYGFPLGGDTLSATEGVVSRIEHQAYVHSGAQLLAVQIDAAINAGNSGGPVVADGTVVGVVMQSIPTAANIGYLVPTPVIEHFLRDIEDGKLDGLPAAGFVWQPLESESLRRFLRLPELRTGVLITRVLPFTPASGKVCARDVLVAIDGHTVAFDGTIELRSNLRTNMMQYIQQHQIGDLLRLTVFRAGRMEDLEIHLDVQARELKLVPAYQYDTGPTYFIYGGLVLNPLTANYLQSFQGSPPPHLAVHERSDPTEPGEQIVVLNRVLPSAANIGYHDWQDRVLAKLNGHRFHNLPELVHLIETASEPVLVFENDEGQMIVLDRQQVEAEREQLLRTYGIPADRSDNLGDSNALAVGLARGEPN